METKFIQAIRLTSMAVVALLMAACSSDDYISNDNSGKEPAEAQVIPFTATITTGGNATRALSDPDSEGKIQASWDYDEEIALVYKVSGTTVVTRAVMDVVYYNYDYSAIIKAGLVTGVTSGTAVTLIYPYSAVNTSGDDIGMIRSDFFTGQNGELTGNGSISANYDLRIGTGTIIFNNDGSASLSSNVSMASQIAIWKLSLMNYEDGATDAYAITTKSLAIKDGNGNVLAATDASKIATSKSEFYMAVPAISHKAIRIEADDDDTYVLSKSDITLAASTYYQSTAKLARTLSSARVPSGSGYSASPGDVGKVVSADGRIFKTTAAATAAGTTGVAMICRVNTVGHGLAIELNSNPGTAIWADAEATAAGTTSVPGATPGWRLPSTSDWSSMFDGCIIADNPESAALPADETTQRSITSFKDKYSAAAGYGIPEYEYWTSTELNSGSFRYVILSQSTSLYAYYPPSNFCHVLACLAF
jgi:hypothetical protein